MRRANDQRRRASASSQAPQALGSWPGSIQAPGLPSFGSFARSLQQGDVDTLELGLAFVRELTPQLEARLAGAWASQNADTGTLDEYGAANGFLGIVWHRR